MSGGGTGQGALYSPLPQSISDTDSSEEELISVVHHNDNRKFVVSGKESVDKRNGQKMGDYRPLGHDTEHDVAINGFPARGPITADDVPIIKSEASVPRHLEPMSALRKIFFVLSILLCGLTIVIFLWVLPCDWATCPSAPVKSSSRSWEKTLTGIELKGRISVVSGVAGRSHNLVFLLRGDILSSLLGQPKPNEEVAETFPTKGGGLLSLIGSTGEVAWWKRLYHLPHDIDCSLMDVSDDGINDCIVVGAESLLVTVDPLSGAIIWHVHNHTLEDMNAVNISFPLVLPDLDGDSLYELLATCSLSEKNSSGYSLVSEPKVSLHNYMILISGKTGRVLGHPLEMKHCFKISSLVLESDGNVSYTCQDFKGKDSTNIILIQELYTKATLKPLPSNINFTQFKNQSLKQHVILNSYKMGGRRLTLENLGHCPSHCNTTVRIFDERASRVNEMVWNYTGENTYAMIPATLTFNKRSALPGDTALDQVSGFVLKLWHWNTANIRHVSVEGNSQDESSTKPLYRNRLRREITSETWPRLQDYPNSSTRTSRSVQPPFAQNLKCPTLSNMTIHQLNERVVLITFNATDMHIVNTSQSDITQLCTHPETAGEHPTCQPDLTFQEQSLLIADLDRDGSQELISYLTTFVFNKDVDSAAVWKLQSKVRVIRLESELPKLYEAVTQQ
ncbi:uncharacterized protein [Anabrus simplex]|uniref:uncharacterized protein n=1 Tax=Anabrus simplex TaxID=316456 RepID=UPI0035A32324